MERSEFKKRMQSLKSYRENNPGKGYWDWKVEQFEEGGQTQRRELGDSPYEDPRIEDRFKPRFELRKGPVSYYGNLFTKLAKAARSINVLGTIGEFVQNVFPSKEQEYLNNVDTYFDKQARNKTVIPIQKLDEGGSVSSSKEKQEEDRQWIINWLKRRQEYNNPAVQKQAKAALQRAEWDARSPYTTKYSIYTVPVTYKNMRDDWGGYYHPNEGVVLNPNIDLQKYGEPLIHEFSHSVNTNNAEIRNTINTITDKQKIIDRGSDMNTYLTSPEEIHSRLMEFRKLNNLDPTKRVGMPQLQYIKKHGKDRDLLNLFVDDQVVLDLLNDVATTKSNIIRVEDGGEVPPSDYQGSNEPVNVNPFTKKPLANGSITPVLDLEDASSFTPIGDILSIRDAYIAAKNKDLLGLGLAGLGFMPFIPTVNRKATQDLVDKAIRQSEKSKQVVDDFYTQRNNVYESMIENEDAFRRAARADRQAGTDYVGTYGQAIGDYLRDPSQYNDDLPSMRFDRDLYGTNIKMQVDPSRPGYITVNPRYKDPDELDDNFKRINPGLVRHEMGHQTDLKAGLQYTDRLADPKKFVSDDKLKEMFSKSYNRFKSTVLNKGSEIKSYMNEFREFLMNQRQWEPKESINTFRKKLDRYGKQFPTLRMIFDSYKSKSDFVRDYNTVPITSTETDKIIV